MGNVSRPAAGVEVISTGKTISGEIVEEPSLLGLFEDPKMLDYADKIIIPKAFPTAVARMFSPAFRGVTTSAVIPNLIAKMVSIDGSKVATSVGTPDAQFKEFSYMPSTFYSENVALGTGEHSIKNAVRNLKDFFSKVIVLKSKSLKYRCPIAEVHRPQVKGCVSSLELSHKGSTDLSLSVKILGLGGGSSFSKEIGYSKTIKVSGECVRVEVPVTVTMEYCESKGQRFWRSGKVEIDGESDQPSLLGEHDHCGIPSNTVKKAFPKYRPFNLPRGITQIEKLWMESGFTSEVSLEADIAAVKVGPKAQIKLLRKTTYSYELAGPGSYLAYLPVGGHSHCWSWK